MTTDNYISENKTTTLKKGDTVVMHSCGEADFPKYKGKVWTCQTDSFINQSNTEVVFLHNFSGSFLVKYLKIIN